MSQEMTTNGEKNLILDSLIVQEMHLRLVNKKMLNGFMHERRNAHVRHKHKRERELEKEG